MLVDDVGTPGLGVLLLHVGKLLGDDLTDALGIVHRGLEVGNLSLQCLHLLGALEDILLIDVAQANVGHIFGLNLVDAKPDHQVGHHLRVLLCLPDDGDGPVDVQQDPPQTFQQVQLILLLLHLMVHPAAHTVHTPGGPLLQNFPHSHHPGHTRNEDVEVAGLGIHERGGAEQLGHELIRVGAPFEVDGQLQTGEISLVPHVGNFLDLARLDQLRHLVHNGLRGGGVGNLIDLDEVFAL